MKSYEIVETLRKSGKAVFRPKDIAKITELKGSEVYVRIIKLYKKGMIFKSMKGFISLSQDPFIISSQL